MSPTTSDIPFYCMAAALLGTVALRPDWAIYLLTYGRPERANGRVKRIMFMRMCAAVGTISAIVSLMIIGIKAAFA